MWPTFATLKTRLKSERKCLATTKPVEVIFLNVHQPRLTGPAAGPDVKTKKFSGNWLNGIHKLNRPSLVKSSRKARGLAPTTDEKWQPDFTIHILHFVAFMSSHVYGSSPSRW